MDMAQDLFGSEFVREDVEAPALKLDIEIADTTLKTSTSLYFVEHRYNHYIRQGLPGVREVSRNSFKERAFQIERDPVHDWVHHPAKG